MDWDSDAKDEVDGDVSTPSCNNNINGRRGKLKIDDGVMDKRKAISEETEDDEQKKLHEGASALLNLAGFLFDQSRERAGGLGASADGDEHGDSPRAGSHHGKRFVSKGRPPKKMDQQKEAEKSIEKTPSKSKRKNAGNNAKYDNNEYSLGKNSGKARPALAGNARSKKTQSLKSAGGKSGRKVTKPISKAKSSVGRVNSSHKAVKKKAVENKKLKLSKTFGKKTVTTKSSSDLFDKNQTDLKRSLAKNAIMKNGLNKRTSSSASKIKDHKEVDKASEGEMVVTGTQPSSLALDTADNESSKSSITIDSAKVERDHTLSQLAHNNNNNNNNISKNTATVKNGVPTASGDAPAQIKTESNWEDETVPSHNTPPPTVTFPAYVSSHKSPHFTRFSKKKSALS